MAKYYGKIGFAHSYKNEKDIVVQVITERDFKGEITRPSVKHDTGNEINPNLTLGNMFSIIDDPYLRENSFAMVYLTHRGVRWSIRKIEEVAPRLNILIGEVYHGPTPQAVSTP